MSLSVYLTDPTSTYNNESLYCGNITHNLAKMADEAGIYEALWHPEKLNITCAKNLIPYIEKGLEKLKSDPEYYRKFNPENGWGSYEFLVEFLEDYLRALKKHPEAKVKVSR